MNKGTLKRALSTGVATTVVAAGLSLGAAPAQAAEPDRPVQAEALALPGLEDLLGLEGLLGLETLLADLLQTGPQLTGSGAVGSPLKVLEPVFDSALHDVLGLVVENDITWLCNGQAIPGVGDVLSFVPTEAQAGCEVAVQTVSTVLGLLPLTLVTEALPILGGGDGPGESKELVPGETPRITGNGRVGGLLQIAPGTWLDELDQLVEPTLAYQWYNTSGAIPGATGRQYVPRPADAGRPVAAVVTATLGGFADGLAVTNVAKVGKLGSKTRLAKAGKLLRVVVAPKGVSPTGKVQLMNKGKAVRTVRLRPADNGQRMVRLPKLRKGVHRFTAVYTGSSALQRSRSKPVRVRVR